jgi:hypothetical protein
MSKIRDFWVGLPNACGVPDGLAQIEGDRNGKLFDWEIANPDAILHRQPGQTSRQRLKPAFVAWEHLAEPHAVEYAKRLGELLDKATRFNAKGLGDKILIDAEAATLKVIEPSIPTVSALMTVDQAVSPLSFWD